MDFVTTLAVSDCGLHKQYMFNVMKLKLGMKRKVV